MSEEPPPSEVLGSLPRSRPHRRSDKRAARTDAAELATHAEPAEPIEAAKSGDRTNPAAGQGAEGGTDLLAGAVKTAAEFAEFGLSTGARALHAVVARLPRP